MYKLEAILEAARNQNAKRVELWSAERDSEIENLAKQSDKSDIKTTLMRYNQCQDRVEQYSRLDTRPIEEAYHLFDRMSYDLQRELGAQVTNDQILFKWNGKSLSFILQLLADHYHIKSGMFTFDSGFTTHEAYTENTGYKFSMGLVKNNDDVVIIDFNFRCFFKEAKLY